MKTLIQAIELLKAESAWNDEMIAAIPDNTIIKIFDRVGQDPEAALDHIGSGTNGAAYKLANGKVLKFTVDSKEAHTAAVIRENPNPKFVFNCYDVFRFKLNTGKEIFCVLQELLQPADADWSKFIEDFYGWLIHDDGKERYRKGVVEPKIVQQYAQSLSPEDKNKLQQKLAWLWQAGDYLKSVGIEFYDMHEGNIMKRTSGEHIIIDLGLSALKGRAPIIETVAKTKIF